jgi:hypothetical protein
LIHAPPAKIKLLAARPTFVEMSGAKPPQGYETDGLSLLEYLKGGKAPRRDYFRACPRLREFLWHNALAAKKVGMEARKDSHARNSRLMIWLRH